MPLVLDKETRNWLKTLPPEPEPLTNDELLSWLGTLPPEPSEPEKVSGPGPQRPGVLSEVAGFFPRLGKNIVNETASFVGHLPEAFGAPFEHGVQTSPQTQAIIDAIGTSERPVFDVPEAETFGEKSADVLGSLAGFIAQLAALKKVAPQGGASKLSQVASEALTWASQDVLNRGSGAEGATMGAGFGALQAIPAVTPWGKLVKLAAESGALGGMEYAFSGDPERAVVMALVPAGLRGTAVGGKFLNGVLARLRTAKSDAALESTLQRAQEIADPSTPTGTSRDDNPFLSAKSDREAFAEALKTAKDQPAKARPIEQPPVEQPPVEPGKLLPETLAIAKEMQRAESIPTEVSNGIETEIVGERAPLPPLGVEAARQGQEPRPESPGGPERPEPEEVQQVEVPAVGGPEAPVATSVESEVRSKLRNDLMAGSEYKMIVRPVGSNRAVVEIMGQRFTIDNSERLSKQAGMKQVGGRKTRIPGRNKTGRDVITFYDQYPRLGPEDFPNKWYSSYPQALTDRPQEVRQGEGPSSGGQGAEAKQVETLNAATDALYAYRKRRGYNAKTDPDLLQLDVQYRDLKERVTAARRRQGAATGRETRELNKGIRQQAIESAETGKVGPDQIKYAPIHLLPDELRTTIQAEARSLLLQARSEKTRRALQKIIDDAGKDKGGDVEQQKERITEILTGDRDTRNAYEKQIGMPERPPDPIVAVFAERDPTRRAQMVDTAIGDVEAGRPNELADQARRYIEDRQQHPLGAEPEEVVDFLRTIGRKAGTPGEQPTKNLLGETVRPAEALTGEQGGFRFEKNLAGEQVTESGAITAGGKLRPDVDKAAEARIAAEDVETGQMVLPQQAATSGGGGMSAGFAAPAKGPIEVPPVSIKAVSVEVPTRRKAELRPVAMPELFQLAKTIMGHPPVMANLRKNLGLFKHNRAGDTAIKISRAAATDERALAEVMAHEVGHLVDYIPDKTLARGNLLGRIESLRKFMKGMRGGLKNKEVKAELIGVAKWWHPYDESASKKYKKLRESSRELYADALSVFLNSPSELRQRAPKFFDAMVKHMDRKPEFLDAYLELQDVLAGKPEAVAARRRETIKQMMAHSDQVILAHEKAREAAESSPVEEVRQFFEQFLLDRRYPAISKAREAAKLDPKFLDDATNAEYIIDELNHTNNANYRFLDRFDKEVWTPLKEGGVTRDDLFEYMFARRIVDQRGEIANPLGFTASTSSQQLADMEARLGPERWKAVEDRMLHFHRELLLPISKRAADTGYYSKEAFDKTIAPNADAYAAFAVLHYYEGHVSPAIKKQVGTFSEVAHPLEATLMKFTALNRAVDLNQAKATIRDVLKTLNDTTEVPIPYGSYEPAKRPGPGREHIIVMEDGKPHAYEVPANVADSLLSHDIGGLTRIAAHIRNPLYKIMHPLLVTYSPSFLSFNPFRDFRRTWRNMGAIGGKLAADYKKELIAGGMSEAEASKLARSKKITLGQVLHAYWKAMPASSRRARGISDDTINKMLDEKALGIPFVDVRSEIDGADYIERSLKKMGIRADADEPRLRLRDKMVDGLKRGLAALEYVGTLQETASKVASYTLLEERGMPTRERAYSVRKYAGTPDIGQAGLATPITNSVWMYSKVRINGLQADTRLATDPKTAGGFWWRAMVGGFVPTVTKYALLAGAGGTLLQEIMKRVPSYYLTNYDIIPLGTSQNENDKNDWKAVFLTVPQDEYSKLLSKVLWYSMDSVLEKGTPGGPSASKALSDIAGEIMPSTNPFINIASKWSEFAMGRNPYDTRFGGYIVPRTSWDAGGWEAGKRMLLWTSGQFGALSAIGRIPLQPTAGSFDEVGKPTTFQVVTKSVPGVSSLVRVSDRGMSERQWSELENEDQESARFRMSLPESARQATLERWSLNRQGERLPADERGRRAVLNAWYNSVYLPATKTIKGAEEAGQKAVADQLRAKLDMETRNQKSNEAVTKNLMRQAQTPIPYQRTKHKDGTYETIDEFKARKQDALLRRDVARRQLEELTGQRKNAG
jgi:hypothetical protein